MVQPINRKRGGQPGNQNATKNGYYSQAFKKNEQLDFDAAASLQGFGEEIALLRFEIKKAVSSGDTLKLIPLAKAAYALEKLIRTNHKLYQGDNWVEHRKNLMRNGIIPIGGEKLAFYAIKNWCGYTEEEADEKFQYSNDVQPEAGLTYNEKPKSESV